MQDEGLKLNWVKFNDGSKFEIDHNGIFVITGPNNCGKSQLIREIFNFDLNNVVLSEKNYDVPKNVLPLLIRAIENPALKGNENFIISNFAATGGNINSLLSHISSNVSFRNAILQEFSRFAGTADRLAAIQTSTIQSYPSAGPMLTLHSSIVRLFEDRDFERSFHDIIKTTFGIGVLINRYKFGGAKLHFLDVEDVDNRIDKSNPSFAQWFDQQPLLDLQGDGVRSFCAVLLTVMDNPKPLILIDEPEAFLHPPQIRRLAYEITQHAPSNTQLIVATHSADFIQGILDFAPNRTNVIRLSREKRDTIDVNIAKKLSSEDIKVFWNDSLLKTSDVFSSLFHDVAVVVEGDSDARFMRALFDQTSRMFQNTNLDVRFYHCGGKHRIKKIVRSLRAIGVPVVALVDIDILDNKSSFLELYRSFDYNEGNFTLVETLFDSIDKFVRESKSVLNKGDAEREINRLISNLDPSRPIPQGIVTKINEALQASSAWRLLKRTGSRFFTRGEPNNNYERLSKLSEQQGLFINNLGELENFDVTIEARKEDWLYKVLNKDLAKSSELEDARILMKNITDWAKGACGKAPIL